MHGAVPATTVQSSRAHAKSARQLGVTLQENMVFICKPSAIAADGKSLSTPGAATIVVTATGGKRLGTRRMI
jgi:hypothetical protein